MDEKEIETAEVEEVKEAIRFIGEYCSSCYDCDDCDNEIRKWCNGIKKNPPEEWDEAIMTMDKKDILIESAKYISEYCAEHSGCSEDCVFYTKRGADVCLFGTAYVPCKWDFETVEDDYKK